MSHLPDTFSGTSGQRTGALLATDSPQHTGQDSSLGRCPTSVLAVGQQPRHPLMLFPILTVHCCFSGLPVTSWPLRTQDLLRCFELTSSL